MSDGKGGNISVSYIYDALGRRLIRKDNMTNEQRLYYYDGLSVIAEKKKVGGGSWNWDKIYTIASGVISNIIAESYWNEYYWDNKFYYYDAIGNVVCLTDSNGEPLDFFDQDAYGNVKSGTTSGYHLHTKEYDSESNLYYSSARWYEPQLGRFISKDPIIHLVPLIIKKIDANVLIDYGSNPLYLNPYIFALNNPLKYIDESGGCSKKPGRKGRPGTPAPITPEPPSTPTEPIIIPTPPPGPISTPTYQIPGTTSTTCEEVLTENPLERKIK